GSCALADILREASVTIRGAALAVQEALHSALAQICDHVGQLVFFARAIRGDAWKNLSIPLGQSEEFNRNAIHQDPASHAALIVARLGSEGSGGSGGSGSKGSPR